MRSHSFILRVAIILTAVSILLNIMASETIRRSFPGSPLWALPALAVLGVFNIICLIAIFKWKKWGFYAALVFGLFTFFVNMVMGVGVVRAVLGLAGIAILYGVLQIGGEKKGWRQLE